MKRFSVETHMPKNELRQGYIGSLSFLLHKYVVDEFIQARYRIPCPYCGKIKQVMGEEDEKFSIDFNSCRFVIDIKVPECDCQKSKLY